MHTNTHEVKFVLFEFRWERHSFLADHVETALYPMSCPLHLQVPRHPQSMWNPCCLQRWEPCNLGLFVSFEALRWSSRTSCFLWSSARPGSLSWIQWSTDLRVRWGLPEPTEGLGSRRRVVQRMVAIRKASLWLLLFQEPPCRGRRKPSLLSSTEHQGSGASGLGAW